MADLLAALQAFMDSKMFGVVGAFVALAIAAGSPWYCLRLLRTREEDRHAEVMNRLDEDARREEVEKLREG